MSSVVRGGAHGMDRILDEMGVCAIHYVIIIVLFNHFNYM